MIKVALVRGKYLNNFEGQNYKSFKKIKIIGVSSLKPIHERLSFQNIKLPSLADLPFKKQINFASNRILGDSQLLFGLEKILPKFDIVHTADPHYFYSYQAAKLRKQGKINKLIVTSWETIPFNNESVYKKKMIKRFSMSQADLFLCYTPRAKNALIKEGISKDNIKTVYLGVDLKRFKRSNKKNKKSINILFVGRLVKEKGVEDLIEVLKKIKNEKGKVKLTVVGDGPLRNEFLKNRTNELVYLKNQKYENLHRLYQDADIFIGPSRKTKTWEEQYGMVFVEAMACGLPIVSYETGAIPEIVSEGGILVKEGNIRGLITSTLKLIKDPSLRLRIGKIGERRAKLLFDSKKTEKKIEEIYETLYSNSSEE